MGQILRFFRGRTERAEMWAGIFQARRQLSLASRRHSRATLVATGQYYNPTPPQLHALWARAKEIRAGVKA